MKLTQQEISSIYYLISNWFSQRFTARSLWHSRRTIARYLEPQVMADHIMNCHYDIADTEYDTLILKNKVSLYRNLAIAGFIGFIAQALINIFY